MVLTFFLFFSPSPTHAAVIAGHGVPSDLYIFSFSRTGFGRVYRKRVRRIMKYLSNIVESSAIRYNKHCPIFPFQINRPGHCIAPNYGRVLIMYAILPVVDPFQKPGTTRWFFSSFFASKSAALPTELRVRKQKRRRRVYLLATATDRPFINIGLNSNNNPYNIKYYNIICVLKS